jgi:large subunit ribosomal protein L21
MASEKYAVIRIQGQQFLVKEGQEILVGHFDDPKKAVAEVLLFVNDDKVQVGKPTLKDVTVKLKILAELEKGEKVDVYHFKAKSRFRKHTGFRPQFTKLLVEKIS